MIQARPHLTRAAPLCSIFANRCRDGPGAFDEEGVSPAQALADIAPIESPQESTVAHYRRRVAAVRRGLTLVS